jgi:hypothetical protein
MFKNKKIRGSSATKFDVQVAGSREIDSRAWEFYLYNPVGRPQQGWAVSARVMVFKCWHYPSPRFIQGEAATIRAVEKRQETQVQFVFCAS